MYTRKKYYHKTDLMFNFIFSIKVIAMDFKNGLIIKIDINSFYKEL